MMITVLIAGTMFGLGALFAAIRLVRGPTQIDRAVALDVMLAIVVGVIVLTAAVSGKVNPQVNLVNTLNNGEFTVFAPVDTAFAKIDAATMTKLTTDSALLSGILTYHVVPGELSPTEVVGTHTTANGATLEVTGSGDNLKVNGATVICGGVQTKNATVYLIDTVLTPPSS